MIEPDINERMARFAPSQNMGDPGDDAVERAVAGMAGMPARPQFEQDEAIDSAVLQIAGERRQDMAASLMAASQVNPDQAARASRLGDQFGVGQDIALRNMQELERESTVRDIQRMDLMRNDPVLARYLSDRAFASEAQDDVGILAKMRPLFMEAALVSALGPVPVLKRGFERGSITAERGDIGSKAMAGFATPADFDRVKQIEEEMRSLGEMGILGTTAEMVGQNVAQLRTIGTTAVAGAAAGSLVGPAGTVAGGALGATAGVITSTASMEAGNLYLDLRNDGVNDETAIPTAIAGGFLNGVIEVVGMKIAAKPFQALAKRLMSEAVSDAIKKPTMRAALAAAGKGYLTQVGTEGAEEALQETVIIAGEEIAKAIDGVDSETGMREAVGRVLESFMYGAMGSSILGGIGPGANLLVDLRRASNSERQQKFFDGLTANNKDSRLAQRSPVGYERFLAAQAEGTNAETIYVDGRIAQQVLAQSGVPVAQLEEIIPGIRERIAEAVETGGDVTIPTARFGAKLANTNLGNALLPHMRLSPDAMSATESQEFATRRQEVVREAEQILAQKQETDATFVQQARQIEDTLTSQIVATGQIDERAARSSAQFMRDFYVTQAAALGMTPKQVYERFPVRVEGAMPAAAPPLEQADQFDQAGQRRTDTPEFKAWSNDAPVIANEQSEAHEFTTGTPVVVEALHGSTERGLRRFDVGRAVEVLGAIFFTSNPAVAEQYTYERAYNEIISEQPIGDVIRAYVAFANPMVYQPKGKVVDAIEMGRAIEQAKAAGHDGLIIKNIDDSIGMTGDMGDVYVTWNPTSIKSVNNRGTWSRETADIMRQAGTGPRLMAVHNLSADNLAFAERMGGLAVPSIGVVTEQAGGVEGFGEITLIGSREMADPSTSRVFEADAYSARFPQPEWPKVPVAKADKFVQRLREVSKKYDDSSIVDVTFDGMVNNPDANKISNYWMRSSAAMALFLRDKGIEIEPKMRVPSTFSGLDWNEIDALRPVYNAVNQNQSYDDMEASPEYAALQEAYANAIRAKYAPIADDMPAGQVEKYATEFGPGTMSRLQRDMQQTDRNKVSYSETRDALETAIQPYQAEFKTWVDSTIREQFGAPFIRDGKLKKPYTLGNIVDAMTSAKVKGEEKGMTFGAGAARAAASEEFVDLEQMREAASTAIVDPEKYAEESKKSAVLLEAYRNAMADYSTLSNWRGQIDTWAALDGSMRAIARYGNRKRKSEKSMRDALRREGFDVSKMPPELIDQAIEAASALYTAPVPYFEAKPQRAVGLGEFKGAVIPSNASAETRSILERNNIPFVEYGSEQTRTADVRKFVDLLERGGKGVFFQAAAGPARGGFDPSRLTTILNKTADLSTFLHESAHAFLTFYEQMSQAPNAPARIVNDMDELLRWFGIDGATQAERIANWNVLTLDQKRKYHETFAYNFEVYLFEGKAPSAEMQGMFERFGAWLKRVYKSIRDDLNAIYRREFGEDLPILTGEVRQVMDRMLATDEQIKRQAAINEMKPQFQTQEQSGMDDAEWAAYQAMQQEAIEASVTDMNKASMRQLQWLGNARSRILRDMQKKHDAKRKEVAAEVAAAVRVEPLYRAMTYLRTGKFIDTDGAEVVVEGPHRLDIKRVQAIYAGLPSEKDMEAVRATGQAMPKVFAPDIAKLGTGKFGMMGVDGLDPDVVAESFGFGSGDQMIRALLEAKPIKEAVAERTDAEMLRRFGDMNTPEAQEAEVQKALHNEARARFVAVELRHVARATEPVRVMLEAAKQVARELIAGMTLREVRPADFIAAEARAARDAGRMGTTVNPEAVGQTAQTRAYNEAIDAGTDPAEAMAAAIEKGAEAARKAQERSNALKAQYGADPQQALIRAKRAQLYQNQLAAEALRVREEVAKQVKYLRRILRDTNVKAMGAQAADQIAGLLERFEVAPVSLKRLDERKALAAWLAEQEAAGLVPDIAPEVADEARRVNYQQLTVAEFRDLVDAIRQIEFIGKNERKVQLAAERAAYEEKRDEIVTRIRAVGRLRGVKFDPRSPLTNIGRSAAALRGFAAQHLKAASVARILDGGEDDGPLWTFAIRSANAAADMETRMRAEASAKLAEILAPVFALGNMGGKGVLFPSINRSLNREARIAIALNVGNDGNRQRLLDGEGWTMEQIQPVLESLTEAEWNAVQQVWDYIDTYRPLIAEKERRLYGKEPQWVTPVPMSVRTADGKTVNLTGGYYPIKYDPIASDRVATVDEAAEAKRALDGAYTAATTRRSFVKSRVREVVGRPLLYTLDAAFGGINDVIHDLSWHEWLIQTQRLLRDPEFANAVRETRGPEFLKQLRDWAKDNAAGERKIGVAGEAALSWLRQGISASGLGFNVVSAAMQVTGFNQSIVRLGAKYVGRGVAQFAASPIDTARMVADKSSFMAERGRTQFREINEIRNRVRGQTEMARRVTAGTYFLMMNMQRTVDIPTWLAGYQKALDAGKDDAKAVALADQAVRDTQGSGLISDLAAIERGGPVMKLFTVFYSYMNTVYNMTAVQTMTARSKGKLAADYAMLLVVPVVLGQAIKNLIQPDAGDDELDPEALARKLAAEELSFLMGTMVIAREFGGAAQLLTGAEGVRMGYGGPAGLRAVGEVYGLATQAGQLDFDRAFRRSAINTLGAFTGLPSAQVNRTIDGIEAVIEGEVEGVGAVVAPLTGVQR